MDLFGCLLMWTRMWYGVVVIGVSVTTAMWHWTQYLIFLSLSFLVCKMRIIKGAQTSRVCGCHRSSINGFSPLPYHPEASWGWYYWTCLKFIPISSSGLVSSVGEGWKPWKVFTDRSPRDSPSGRGCEEKQKSIFICFLMLTNSVALLLVSGDSRWVSGQAVFPRDIGSWDFSLGGSSWGSCQVLWSSLCVESNCIYFSSS